jgi:hypothetical protein
MIHRITVSFRLAICLACLLFATVIVAQPPTTPPNPPDAMADFKPAASASKSPEAEATDKLYLLPYLLIVMAIAVGLMIVCRPSRRGES